MAYNVAVVTLLTTLSNGLREHYLNDNLYENYGWYGRNINKMFNFRKSTDIQGKDHYWQVEAYKSRPVRTSRDITGGFSNYSKFDVVKLRARLSETAAENDFSRYDASVRTSLLDLERGARDPKQYVVNTVPRLAEQLIQHAAESMAVHRMVDKSARLGTVNSVAKQNDNTLYASATATPVVGGTTGIRVLITGGSPAYFQPGLVVKIQSGSTSTVRVTNALITDYNPIDGSVGFKRWDITTRAVTTNGDTNPENLIGVTTNDTIFISGERNLGMSSVGEWMATTVPSGDTLYNVDRSLPENSWMRPTTLQAVTSGTTPFDVAYLDQLSNALAYVNENFSVNSGYINLTTPELDTSFRNQVGRQNIVILPTTEQAGVLARYGFEGSIYVHPGIGKIGLTPEALATPNKMQFLRPGDWTCLVGRDFSPVPRANAIGDFYDVKDTATGTGTLEYQVDYFGLMTDICERIRTQAQITNIA